MMKHFNKLGAPLYSIHEYPSLREQERRFRNAGWTQAQARSLWDLWSDDDFLSSSTRASLDSVEAFDEWEEFALFASHYFLLHASTREPTSNHEPEYEDPCPSVSPNYTLLSHCLQGNDQRRYGAIVPDTDHSLGYHGGLGRQTRLASTSLYGKSKAVTRSSQPFPPNDMPARMCHTVTPLAGDDCLLVGGRASPAAVFQDCWLRKGGQWKPTHSLPEPRFRHSAVRVALPDETEGVLIYGGKTSDGQVLDSWILWNENGNGWQAVETFGEKPPARLGACLELLESQTNKGTFEGRSETGILFGGVGKDSKIMEDIWTLTLHQRTDGKYTLHFNDLTYALQSEPLLKYTTRFGATTNSTPWGLVVAGGIMPRQIVPADKEILLLDFKELLKCLDSGDDWNGNLISEIGLGKDFRGPRPLLTGHASHAASSDQLVILGGGAVCFSFGTFWTEGTWVLKRTESTLENKWAVVAENVQPTKTSVTPKSPEKSVLQKVEGIPVIPRVKVQEPAQFQQILADGKPVVIEGSDIGPCRNLWTKEYLTDAVGSDRKIVVHEAQSEHMSFQSKNFAYTTKEFGTFMDEVHAGGRQYLRSISADQPSKLPANLAVDFPNLHRDFQLPAALSFVMENAHSSPLRISGFVTLWLHYDVSIPF